ncbi:MAG TPA: hypothetical protein G4N99_01930 [Thermoflexia bacterium]|nr:hypothetical protein [Thermoflexia bacterium]
MNEQRQILELIESGGINVEEGVRRLEALAETAAAPKLPPAPRPALVRWLWQGMFWIGVALLAWGGWLLSSSYTSEAATAGRLIWAWVVFVLGVLGVMLGWWLQQARWLYVRVRQHDGPNITLAFPLPLGLVTWGLRIAQPFVPQLENAGVDKLFLAMQDELRDDHPFVVKVDDGENGEQVQVYFG